MIAVENIDVRVGGRFLKIARLLDEYYVTVKDPATFSPKLRDTGRRIDLFTFVQELHERIPKYDYHYEFDSVAVLRLSTFDNWINKQITFKPRNKLRKALKSGVQTCVVDFSDELLHGIMDIYNETPIRQGKRNRHFGKDFETLKREHATFLDCSQFIGAYFEDELIGFAKVTHSKSHSIIMNIVAKVRHRDKAPTNALLAKTIELVTDRNIPLLKYGVWGGRGLNDFKTANAFECFSVPRYYIPLTLRGRLALRLNLHHGLKERLPSSWIGKATDLRAKWNELKYGKTTAKAVSEGSVINRRVSAETEA